MPLKPIQSGDEAAAVATLGDKLILKGSEDYEDRRRAACWRGNKPKRYPEAIVMVENDQDAVAAVKLARARGWKITVRSRGHSWSASHVRDGVLLVDLSRMQDIIYDPADQTVTISPPIRSRQLNDALGKFGRMFPCGHHNSVGLGGFMMAGGFGWNCRQWGNGCEQILWVDIVTPEGELIRADEKQNSDYFWAVRGAGPGFFGVATRFKLKTYAMPACMRQTVYTFALDDIAELTRWMASVADKAPSCLEIFLSAASHDENGGPAPTTISLIGFAFAESEEQAHQALSLLESCPIRDRAIWKVVEKTFVLPEAYENATSEDREGMRFATDNFYTNAEPDLIAERLPELFRTLPTPCSHIYWLNWGKDRAWKNMALSVQGKMYVAAYTLWDNEADDEAMEKWPVDQFRKLDDISVGAQMNDENIKNHPVRYLSESAEKRLEELRAKYDPEGLFASYLR